MVMMCDNVVKYIHSIRFHQLYLTFQIVFDDIIDYHGNVQAQIDRSVESGEDIWKMPAKYYALTKTSPPSSCDIFSIIINIDTAILEPDRDDTESLLDDPIGLKTLLTTGNGLTKRFKNTPSLPHG
jgi:hypothetical protein